MIEVFKTIASSTEGLYKSKGSKFIAFAIPVQSVEEVKEIISAYHRKYHDARHICYAYVLQPDRSQYRANDDGEPSGTAGRPILGQINSKGLTNVLVVVIRYFGGILLGTGGLITAYKEAAASALGQALIVERDVELSFEVHFHYPMMNEVMKLVKESDVVINDQFFGSECMLKCAVPVRNEKLLLGKLNKINDVHIIL
ncbi:MAG: YigZ family protein [Paludibacter sp.]|nr:YigZ family protein [Paludibacter sp.]